MSIPGGPRAPRKRKPLLNKLKSILIMEEGDALETHRERRIPYDKPLEIPAILRFPKSRHRQLSIQWAFGRFPPLSTSLLEEKFRAIVDTPSERVTDALVRI